MALARTQRKIVKIIQRLHRLGEPLNITAVKRRHPELIEAVYAVKPFWGWKKALEAAGISYADIKVELQDYCFCEICRAMRAMLAPHLWHKHGVRAEDYSIDYPDAEIVCERLRARKSNKSAPHWEPIWTPEYILDLLWDRYERGLPIFRYAISLHESSFAAQIDNRFGSFDNALRRLGLNPNDIRRVRLSLKTTQEFFKAIARRRRLGLPLYSASLQSGRYADCRLFKFAIQRFGGWRQAIEAAGLDYSRIIRRKKKYPTPESVLHEIGRRRRKKLPLVTTGLISGEHTDFILHATGLKFFRSWKKALLAAGIQYREIAPPPQRKYPTKESVLEEIRRRHRALLPLTRSAVTRSAPDGYALHRSALLFFSTWPRALKRAGLSYEKIVQCSYLKRQKMAEAGGIQYANVPPMNHGKYPTRESVLAAILRRYRARLSMKSSAIKIGPHSDSSLYWRARRYFGTWPQAVESAGFAYCEVAPTGAKYPTPLAALEEIRRRHRKGLPLNNYGVTCGRFIDTRLYSKAARAFGSWAKAVEAAGIPYDKVRLR